MCLSWLYAIKSLEVWLPHKFCGMFWTKYTCLKHSPPPLLKPRMLWRCVSEIFYVSFLICMCDWGDVRITREKKCDFLTWCGAEGRKKKKCQSRDKYSSTRSHLLITHSSANLTRETTVFIFRLCLRFWCLCLCLKKCLWESWLLIESFHMFPLSLFQLIGNEEECMILATCAFNGPWGTWEVSAFHSVCSFQVNISVETKSEIWQSTVLEMNNMYEQHTTIILF